MEISGWEGFTGQEKVDCMKRIAFIALLFISCHSMTRPLLEKDESVKEFIQRQLASGKMPGIQYALVEKEAEKEYQLYRKDPLFWAGLMIYAGEGDRQSRHFVRITNTDFSLHKIFLAFSLKYLGISREKLRVCLSISSALNESLCKEVWANLLGISREQFYKTQIIKGKEEVGRLQYGTGMSIISSTVLKKKIMKWISLAQDENFE